MANGFMTGPMQWPQQQSMAAGPWAGWQGIPATPWGGQWGQMPWMTGGFPTGRNEAAQGMQWMNTLLPWLQAQQQGGQFQQQFDWRKVMDEWTQAFQEQQFAEQQGTNVWTQGFQEQQLRQQAEQAGLERTAAEERTNVEAFGRRWKPNVRWF